MTDLSVGGFVPFSSVDFPLVSVSCVVFCQGCPWSCRYCQNKELQQFKANVSFFEEIFPQIVERKGFLDGVVFSGGEPLVQHAIVEAARRVKAEGFKVALHTAGGFPSVLQDVMEYVDWVGFDIKAPLERYMEVVMPGVASDAPKSAVGSPQDCVKMSLDILKKSGKSFECRTTVDPQIIDRKDLIDIAKFLASTIGIRPIGPLSKPSKSEFWEGDTEHRSGAYLDVREHSSTGSTYPK
ncbi:MAG: anaerobic ribonucleoside-triphosphate reductase activating protein, partial [Holosporales bacterium]|nr:anaerobic ribonucleoside-triphosphate reductase activating protein [Holosporales bacterium]